MKSSPQIKTASAQDVLDLCIATIELYFRVEAATQAIAGFAQAGGEYGILKSLTLEGAQTVPGMARLRPVSRQHCQTICNALERQGFVAFIDNPAHKRSKLAKITKSGRAHYERMTQQFLTASKAYAPRFTAAEMATSIDVLRRAREMLGV